MVDCNCQFQTSYDLYGHPAMRALESEVLGCDYGGTSWTTRQQADEIPAALGLGPGSQLLELGAGTGWPALYLAGLSDCEITLLDVPLDALKHVQTRIAGERLRGRCRSVSGSGECLPFAGRSFDAIGHSDVLCCLSRKAEMLKECRRVARSGARMLFYVIAPARGLSGADLEEACRVGPPFVGVDGDYSAMLAETGWDLLEKTDLSAAYLSALRRMVAGLESRSNDLVRLMGSGEYRDQLLHRHEQVSAVRRGLLVRESYLAQTAGVAGYTP